MVSVKTYQCLLLTVKYFIFLFDKIGDPLQSLEVKEKIQTEHRKQQKETVGESIKVIELLTMDQQELWCMKGRSNKLGVSEIETRTKGSADSLYAAGGGQRGRSCDTQGGGASYPRPVEFQNKTGSHENRGL